MSRSSPGIAGDLPPPWASPDLSAPVAWPLLATLVLHAMIVMLLLVEWPSSVAVIEPPDSGESTGPDVIHVTLAKKPPHPTAPPSDPPAPVRDTETQPVKRDTNIDNEDGATGYETISDPTAGHDENDTPPRVATHDFRGDLDRLLEDEFLAPPPVGPAGDEYATLIQGRVERYWSRPPNARNGMEVLLEIELTSLGDVAGVALLRSSGNPAFDQSATNAVRRAGPFSELQELPRAEFERNFRRFKLLFKPKDLRY